MKSTLRESASKMSKDADPSLVVTGNLADDVRRDLTQSPKQLKPHYLYDTLGSRLFEAICVLPEYPITRAEHGLLDKHAEAIGADMAGPVTLVELGGGNGQKLAQLIEPLARSNWGLRVELVDVSVTALDLAKQTLERFRDLPVICHETTYELGLARVTRRCRWSAWANTRRRTTTTTFMRWLRRNFLSMPCGGSRSRSPMARRPLAPRDRSWNEDPGHQSTPGYR